MLAKYSQTERSQVKSSPAGTGSSSPSLSASASQLTLDLVDTRPADDGLPNAGNQENPLNPQNLGSDTAPHHLLIEGDNLHALTVLNYTHANKVDVIYIDPPYNTGNKDFKYNDRLELLVCR